ncbi:MAG: DUF2442 domain-containing protein [Acidobacteria bacterium]|nr:DUF2442 domain-containing protein [Acidobacteriota bacterium]MBK9526895.1 DUF2442 domain-containing protein [Acidobacteriota bacterium]MBP7476350.1 DUF2442 domain-containing protein [Pyrinomonadaceae bacterium]MBP9109177.1 DUF2442 domain-containing protein [Pyrinomonadaceae bacterium]
MELVRVTKVEPLEDFVVHIWFTNGSDRDVDLEKYLRGPVFEKIRNDRAVFRAIRVTESRTIGWGEDVDIDPDTLYYDLTPAWAESSEMELVA